MKIEHLECQDGTAKDLAWTNLLGACCGNEGAPPEQQTCDTRKRDARLTINPLSLRADQLRYLETGAVVAASPDEHSDLDETLNLNLNAEPEPEPEPEPGGAIAS